jgi:hypothetical protein
MKIKLQILSTFSTAFISFKIITGILSSALSSLAWFFQGFRQHTSIRSLHRPSYLGTNKKQGMRCVYNVSSWLSRVVFVSPRLSYQPDNISRKDSAFMVI